MLDLSDDQLRDNIADLRKKWPERDCSNREKGYLYDCYVAPRSDEDGMLFHDEGDVIVASLQGYSIMPKSAHADLLQEILDLRARVDTTGKTRSRAAACPPVRVPGA